MNTPAAQQPFLRTGGIIYMEEELLLNIKYYIYYYWYIYSTRYIEKVNETLMIEKILNKNHYHRLETEFNHVKYRIYTFCNV